MAKRRVERTGKNQFDFKGMNPGGMDCLVDIVIPVYGQADLLRQCLVAIPIAALKTNYHVYIVDDNSPDDQKPALEILYSSLDSKTVTVFRHTGQSQGFPATANMGAMMGKSPNILFLNSDCILDPGAIDNMVDSLINPVRLSGMKASETSKPGIVGAKLRFPQDSPHSPGGTIQHAGLAFNLQAMPYHVHLGWSVDHPFVNIPMYVQAVTGACLMVSRHVWDIVHRNYQENEPTNGGFSLVYGRGTFEDVELCLIARQFDFDVVYNPKATGTHHVGASVAQVEGGYPVGQNFEVFRLRAGGFIRWDEFVMC